MKNTSKFSASQTEAITAFGKDVAVSAGAGSGKTTVLVERFLRAATLAGSAPEKILAITFTEKAAQEMKTRLVRLCEERGLPELRKRLENAPVSTIDSFCAKLLRENPVEAGVDPYFQILGEGEAELLVNRLLDEIFREEAEGDACFKLLSDYGEDPLRKMLKRHYSRSRSRRDGSPLLQARDHEALLRQTLGQVKAVAEKIMAETAGKKELGDTEAGLREAASGFLGLIAGNAGERRWETYQAVAEAAGKIKKRGRLKELAEEMAALSERWRECLAQKMGEPVKREFARIYALFEQRYEAEKRRLAAYDFTDLLSKAGALLERKDAAGKALLAYYREFFSHILVDEYQDTSPLQAEFIDLLKKKNNLFVVGDEKQSIYGFREADPVILKNKMDSSKVVRLNENYRSRPQVLTWINTFSRHILPPEMYQELLPKRTFETKIDHGVELLCVVRDREETEGVDEARAAEAAILARHIRALVESGRNVEPKGGAVRPLRYGDIAILLRSTTASHLYEKELFDERIPFHVVKGKGFYDKPEIRDLLHFLKWIDNPELDISLACILRSPLFGVSDDGLFWIAKSAKKEDAKTPLFAALIKGAPVDGLGEKDAGKLGFFLEFQENLRKHKNRYRISEILERLLQETAYESKILTGADGRRKVANVRKLVEMARGVEDNYIFGIGDFVCYAESLAAREVVEEEAKIEPEASDAVVISSIHAAKGLEFPCVIVADLGRRGQISDARFLSSDAEGLGIKLKNPVTLEYVKDVSFTRIREEIVRIEAAEEARLLYVAMTRAEELLILSGSASLDAKTGEIKKDSSWMGRILEKTGIDPRNAAGA